MVIIAALILALSVLAHALIKVSYMEMKMEELEKSMDYALVSSKLEKLNDKLSV